MNGEKRDEREKDRREVSSGIVWCHQKRREAVVSVVSVVSGLGGVIRADRSSGVSHVSGSV